MEAHEEPDSSIGQHLCFCSANDRLTGWMEIFKGARCADSYNLPNASTPQFSLTASAWLCVCVDVFPRSGLAVEGADLLGRKEEKKDSGKAN